MSHFVLLSAGLAGERMRCLHVGRWRLLRQEATGDTSERAQHGAAVDCVDDLYGVARLTQWIIAVGLRVDSYAHDCPDLSGARTPHSPCSLPAISSRRKSETEAASFASGRSGGAQ